MIPTVFVGVEVCAPHRKRGAPGDPPKERGVPGRLVLEAIMRNQNGFTARAIAAGVGMALACCTAAHAQVTDDCASAPIAGPVTTTPLIVSGTTVGSTNDPTFGTCVTTHTSVDVFFRVIGTGNRITITTCEATPGAGASFDTKISVYQGDCFAPICVTGNDDSCVGGASTLRSTVNFCSDPGVEYIVMIHGFSAATGTFNAAVFDDGLNCSDPGACCFIDGSCIEVNSDICSSSGGVFQGGGTNCGTTMCPVLTPANDDCANATIVGSLPFFSSGSHQFATRSGWPGSCNSISAVELNNSVWYSYTPTTDCVLVVDVTSFGYDSLFFVLEGGCFGFEADCEDIFPFTGGSGQLVVTASAGVEYVIGIGRWGTSTAPTTGSYTIDIDCIQVVSGACCFGDGSCIEVNTFDCAAAGGVYQGDGTDCGTTFCPDLTGACCFIDGSCIQVLEAACNSSGGIFQGSGTDCGTAFCPDLTPTNNECVDAIALTINGSTSSGNTSLATPSVLPTDCGTTAGNTSPGVWYSVIGDGTTLTASTCNPGSSYDTRLRVFQGADCSFTNCIGQNDDMGSALCPQSGLLSRIVWCSIPGETYYIYVHGFTTTSAGSYEVGVTSDGIDCATPGACCFGDGSCIEVNPGDCATAGGVFQGTGTDCGTTFCPDLTGACCFIDGSCIEVLEAACNSSGGIFQGSGTDCGSTFCPDLSPNNNDCVDAIALTIDGSTSTGNTSLATPSALPSNCGSTGGTASPGVWYSVIGDGTRLTATTCHPGTTFDTWLRVFEGADCSTTVCIGSNDDGSPGGGSDPACHSTGIGVNRASTVIWCSIPGQTYYIYVSGFSTLSGNYEVGVTSDGINCADPGACCFNDGSCIDTIAESCESAGGVFQGGGTSCGTTTCPDLRIGACCLPGDVCVEVTDFDCSGLGGSFQGPNTVCDPAFANSSFPNIAIPDATPAGITDSIVVASSAAITSIEIALDISHTWIGDLLVTVDRNGVEVATLIGRPGVPPATFGDSSDLAGVYIFSDAGAIAIADAAFAEPGAIPPGTYQASDSNDLPVSLNSIFTNTQGTWTLFISDNAGGDVGTLRGWGIGFNGELPVTICSTGPAPCPCDYNNNGLQEIGDYFTFLTAFFAQLGGPGSADFDGDGTVTIGDYFAFLGCLPAIAASAPCP